MLSLGVVLWGLMGGSASGADLLERYDKSFKGDDKKPVEMKITY